MFLYLLFSQIVYKLMFDVRFFRPLEFDNDQRSMNDERTFNVGKQYS